MKRLVFGLVLVASAMGFGGNALAADKVKSKFYDFSEMLIDGEIKKPTALYTDARAKVRFDRLMRLDKNFLQPFEENGPAGREGVFK